MAVLIDTQVMIWLESAPDKLSKKTRELLSKEATVYFSHVSVWEMAIKIKMGKLLINRDLGSFIEGFKNDYRFTPLPILWHISTKPKNLNFIIKTHLID